mmetsp:Transcript_22419/g.65184  ORF Transcript_22419/g.65184 Transcript_22419/m.65184 type:complete len:248 (-) Transcript_22419:75-818(-)
MASPKSSTSSPARHLWTSTAWMEKRKTRPCWQRHAGSPSPRSSCTCAHLQSSGQAPRPGLSGPLSRRRRAPPGVPPQMPSSGSLSCTRPPAAVTPLEDSSSKQRCLLVPSSSLWALLPTSSIRGSCRLSQQSPPLHRRRSWPRWFSSQLQRREGQPRPRPRTGLRLGVARTTPRASSLKTSTRGSRRRPPASQALPVSANTLEGGLPDRELLQMPRPRVLRPPTNTELETQRVLAHGNSSARHLRRS